MLDRVTTLPDHLKLPGRWARTKHWIGNNLNFYRLHMLIFVFLPLILSGIFYGISTAYEISYIDCLFNCVSAMTVTGLATINLSTLSTMQQVLLFLQQIVGSMTFVSIIMILVRIYFFRQEFKHVILEAKRKREEAAREKGEKKFNLTRTISRAVPVSTIKRRLSMMGTREKFTTEPEPRSAADDEHSAPSSVELKPVQTHGVTAIDHAHARPESPSPAEPRTPKDKEKDKEDGKHTPKKKKNKAKINKDMIKRVEGGGVGMVNPMGWYDYSPSHTPGRMSFVGMRPGGANVPDTDAGGAAARVQGATATATDTTASTEPGTGTGTPGAGARQDERGQAPNAGRLAAGIARAKAMDESALDTDSDSDADDADRQQVTTHPSGVRIAASEVPPTILQQGSQDGILGIPSRMFTSSPPAMSDTDEAMLPGQSAAPAKTPYAGRAADDDAFPRAKTIAFEDERDGVDHDHHPATAFPALGPSLSRYGDGYQSRGFTTARDGGFFPRTATTRSGAIPRTATSGNFPRTYTMASRRPETKYNHFGGFPSPLKLIAQLAKKAFPDKHRTLTQTLTMPRSNTIGRKGTIISEMDSTVEKEVPYISFAAVVGRNSRFEGLTGEQMDELGGVEYRALKALLWIVVGYFLFVQLGAFVILAPYVSAQGRYDYVFDAQPQRVQIPWFALFQSVSAFSNTGMSLADQSMVPFQTAYLMTALIAFLIFAGNTAYPVFLRMTVWTVYKLSPTGSRIRETLKFLLDHPRRCFVYLFPSTQTYVLACVMVSLYMIDFVCFLVLDIGNPVISDIPIGIRISNAFGQSAAVRAAGFAFVPLAAVAPAVKVLYVVMMYVSVYPIALSVRSTNVYEEKSLGLFEEEMEDDLTYGEKGATAVAKYVGWHARRQLAFDIWWLGFALWLVCIIERGQLNNNDNATWFNIFNIIFELVSAYGTVGLSLGLPYDNYSFCGSWSTLSKLVVCAVMLRGRHRGLPVAIDRAVMLPRDFTAEEEREFEETRSRRASRRGSSFYESSMLDPVTATGGLYPVPSRTYSRTGAPFTSPRRTSFIDPSSPASVPNNNSSSSPPTAGPRAASGDAVLDGHAAYMQHLHQQTGGGIISPIIGSPLNPMHIRTQSSSAGADGGNSSLQGSPAQLSFALPRTSTVGSRPSVQSGGHGFGMGSGALSPVKESALSRAPTLSEKKE